MRKELTYYLLDVFTDTPFGGNPLAVFTDAKGLSTEQMHKITKELNLSETVFLDDAKTSEGDISMRIFTPGQELPTAGHPTIGTAYLLLALALTQPKQENKLIFEQEVGPITIHFKSQDGEIAELMMEQPLPKFEATFKNKELIAKLLKISSTDLYEDYPCRIVNCGNPFLMVPIKNLSAVKNIQLNTAIYMDIIDEVEITGVLAFTLETEEVENIAHSRMFAPQLGINEDPATGSAHGPLGAYLHNYQLADVTSMKQCEQGFEIDRPSYINIKIEDGNGKIKKVLVGGKSIIMGKGTLYHSA